MADAQWHREYDRTRQAASESRQEAGSLSRVPMNTLIVPTNWVSMCWRLIDSIPESNNDFDILYMGDMLELTRVTLRQWLRVKGLHLKYLGPVTTYPMPEKQISRRALRRAVARLSVV